MNIKILLFPDHFSVFFFFFLSDNVPLWAKQSNSGSSGEGVVQGYTGGAGDGESPGGSSVTYGMQRLPDFVSECVCACAMVWPHARFAVASQYPPWMCLVFTADRLLRYNWNLTTTYIREAGHNPWLTPSTQSLVGTQRAWIKGGCTFVSTQSRNWSLNPLAMKQVW